MSPLFLYLNKPCPEHSTRPNLSLSLCLSHTPSLQAAKFGGRKLLPNELNTLHITQDNIQEKVFQFLLF
jgi:hypothetical protein